MSAVPCGSKRRDEPHRRPRRTRTFQWVPTDETQLEKAEHRMLHSIADSAEQCTVAGLNTIRFVEESQTRTLVLLHGFGGGLAGWVPNWHELIKHTNVYAVDLPGFARSERQPIQFKTEDEAIHYMCSSLLRWVHEMGLRDIQVDICGHSFGAYVAANFALRYPERVSRLILADPWGVPPAQERKLPLRFRLMQSLFYAGNPFSVLRGAGPWGPTILPKVRQDFAERWAPYLEDPNIFYDYIYHCNAHHVPTGERAFQACCTGPVYAKKPLLQSLDGLDVRIRLSFVYGAYTWMDKAAGREAHDRFVARGGEASVSIVPDAGHQVNSDNADVFNEILLYALDLEAL